MQQRQIIFYRDYFTGFFAKQTAPVQQKIEYVLMLVKSAKQVPEKFLKHIEGSDGLYEIRVELGGNIYRIFCCFDKGNLVVLFNAFQKKTQRTPRQHIDVAERLRKEYFNEKNKQK